MIFVLSITTLMHIFILLLCLYLPTPVTTTTVVGVHCLRHKQCALIACGITTRGFRVLQRAVTLLVHRFSCIFLYLYFFATTTVRAQGLLYIVVHTKPVTAYVVRAVLLQAVWPPHALFCASKALWGKFWVGAIVPVSPSIPPTGCQDGSGSLRKHCGMRLLFPAVDVRDAPVRRQQVFRFFGAEQRPPAHPPRIPTPAERPFSPTGPFHRPNINRPGFRSFPGYALWTDARR